MGNMRTDMNPVMRLRVNGSVVTVIFSGNEGTEVKNKVRDILTEAYEERLQKVFTPCGQTL